MKIHLHDLDRKQPIQIDQETHSYHEGLEQTTVRGPADSRWLAYAGAQDNWQTAIVLYDSRDGKRHQVPSGYYDEDKPVYDPDGKYLFFRSGRTFEPVYSELDPTWIYPNSQNLVAVPLRKDVASPLAPRNDDEGDKDKDKKDKSDGGKKDSGPDANKKDESPDKEKKPGEKNDEKAEKREENPPKPVEIDLDDFEQRLVVLPPKAGRYDDLAAVSAQLLHRRLPRSGPRDERNPS